MQTEQYSYSDSRRYEGISWSQYVSRTVSSGVPAWGSGQFSAGPAYGLWFLACIGVAGMQRVYLGHIFSGIVYCLTYGFCGIGQLIDLCMIGSMVNDLNVEISTKVQQRAQQFAQQQPAYVGAPQQPGYGGQPAYGGQPGYPQGSPGYSPQPGYQQGAPGYAPQQGYQQPPPNYQQPPPQQAYQAAPAPNQQINKE
ncbi:hypothetical protein BLNAU_14377 [Blattamonas nauphoetae]|uniref:TM2 domain-containing protein n=1 Tax=Blattamonas nauphoetae TaxID=2049346 RepID=A0ABQ9XE21_9EUKA|nr:hypothetical protein BLNAU_14377 [Blattamonas nauphoetae]